jgi:hypothetical protein
MEYSDEHSDTSSVHSLQPEDIVDLYYNIVRNVSNPWFLDEMRSPHLTILLDSLEIPEKLKDIPVSFVQEYKTDIDRSLSFVLTFVRERKLQTEYLSNKWYNFCYTFTYCV